MQAKIIESYIALELYTAVAVSPSYAGGAIATCPPTVQCIHVVFRTYQGFSRYRSFGRRLYEMGWMTTVFPRTSSYGNEQLTYCGTEISDHGIHGTAMRPCSTSGTGMRQRGTCGTGIIHHLYPVLRKIDNAVPAAWESLTTALLASYEYVIIWLMCRAVF